MTGITLTGEQTDLLKDGFASVSSSFRTNNTLAMEGLAGELQKLNNKTESQILDRTAELAQSRQNTYTSLLQAYASDEFDAEAYRQQALLLYENPDYLAEDYNALRRGTALAVPNYSNSGEGNNLEAYAQNLLASFRSRLQVVKQDKYNDLQSGLEDIYSQKSYWEDRTQELIDDGMTQWVNSTERLIGKRESWRQEFQREFARKDQMWQARYQKLIDNKNIWLVNSSQRAVSTGAQSVAADMGLDADQLIGEVSFSLIPDMTTEAGSVSQMVDEALDGTTIYNMLASVRAMTNRAKGHDLIMAATLPSLPARSGQLEDLTEKQTALKEDLSKALALAQAIKMAEMMRETEKMTEESIDDANKDVDRSVDNTMFDAGYSREGTTYSRLIIIDSSIFGGPETEHHEITAYKDYAAPAFDYGVDLSVKSLKGLNSTLVRARVDLAQDNMKKYLNIVFGNEKESDRAGLDENFLAQLEAQENAFTSSAQYDKKYTDSEGNKHDTGKHTKTKGLFNYYVGYAPVVEKDDPEDVDIAGYGEMGRIYEKFMIQQARLYRGFSIVDQPTYNQKLWDDDANNDGKSDGLIGAPTPRALTDIAVTIAANAVAPGAGGMLVAAALSMADDALFTAMDVANGMDAGQAWGSFGKKATISMATAAVGGVANGFGEGAAFQGLQSTSAAQGSLAVSTGIKAAELTTNKVITSGINSISWDHGLSFDGKGFAGSFDSMNDWAGVAAGTAGFAVNRGLSNWNMQDTDGLGLSKNVFHTNNIKSFNSLASGLTTSAIQYGMTGETKLNVVNFSMFGLEDRNGDTIQSGLLELNLGRNRNLFNIGTGGTDVSYNKLMASLDGLSETGKITGYKLGDDNNKKLFNGLNMMGYSGIQKNYQSARSIFDKEIGVHFESGLTNSNGDLTRGYVSNNDRETINLNSDSLGMGKEAAAQLASLLSHESTHTGGDRTELNAYLNEARTYRNLSEQFDIGDESYQKYLIKQLLDEQNEKENSGEEDNAEWYENKNEIGIKPSNFLKSPLASIKNSIMNIFGGNPYKQNKVPEGEYDYERNELLQKRANKDAFSTMVTLATAARAAQLSEGTMTLRQYMSNYYSLNPLGVKDLNGAIGIANNLDGYLNTYGPKGNFDLEGIDNYSEFKEEIRNLDGFSDVEGYSELQDPKIFKYLEEAGIPTTMEKNFGNDEEAKNRAINMLMDNFNFGSTLYQAEVPAEDAAVLFHLGAIETYTGETGKKWAIYEPGMTGDYNPDLYSSEAITEYTESVKNLYKFNQNNTYPMYKDVILEPLYKWESLNEYFNYY